MKKTLMQLAQEEEQNYSSPIVAAKINGEVRDIQSEYDHRGRIQYEQRSGGCRQVYSQ